MEEITCMLAMNTRRQFFFVITTTAPELAAWLKYFQSIYYTQQVNATWQCDNTGGSSFSKMVERVDGCSGLILLTSCARKNRLKRKMTRNYF